MGRRLLMVATAGLALALLATPAFAATVTWTGFSGSGCLAGANPWSVTGGPCWDPNAPPANGDDVVLAQNGLSAPSTYDINRTFNSITLNNNNTGAYTITNAGGFVLGLQSGGFITDNNTAGTGDAINTGVTLNGPAGATFTLSAGAVGLSLGVSAITGTGPLTLVNNGAADGLRLAVANTYTGATTVNGTARVRFDVDGAVPTGSALTVNGSALFQTSSTIGSLAGGGAVFMNGNNTLTVGGDNTSTTFSGVYQDSGGSAALTKTGSGTFTLSGANTYSGGTTITAGTLNVSADNNLGAAAGGLTFGGGTLQYTTGFSSARGVALNASGGTVDTNGNNAALSGVISGTGGLTKVGAGTLTLSGANTYTGGTTVSAGTLAGTTTSLQGNITNNAAVTFEQSTNGTYAGVMSGTGTLAKIGTGTLTLSGANTYTGGTTLTAGTLQGNTTSLQGNITNNASLVFDQATNGTFAGVISGTGSVTKQNAGTLILSGANAYTGGTTLNAGTLSVSADTNLGAASGALTFGGGTLQYGTGFSSARAVALTAGGGTIDTNGNDATLSGSISGTGGLSKAGTGTLILSGANTYTGGTTITAGALQGNTASLQGNITNNASLVFDQATNGTFAGAITGTGSVTKQNTGTLTLSGANTYTGTTTVNAGTLSVNGSLTSNTTVNAGGILNGTGTITGNVITNSGGTLAPGNSIGTLTVNGNYTQAVGSTLSIEANATGQSDKLVVTGTATLNGGGVVVLPADGTYAVRTTYTILTAASGVAGTFTGVTTSSAFLTPTLSYAPTDVFLTLAQTVRFGSVVTRGNAGRVARALDSVSDTATGDFATLITELQNLSAGQAEGAFTRLSGESHPSALAASGVSVGALLGAVRDRLALSRVLDGAKGASWWLKGYGGTGGVNGDGAATGIDYRFGGVTGGADAALWPDVLVGGSVGYTRTDVDVQGRRDTTAIDMYSLISYGSWSPRLLYVDALLGYAYNQSRTSRHIEVRTLERTAKGSHGGHTLASGVETGYRGQSGALLWTPFVGLTYVRQWEDAFTEHGAGDADLRVQSATLDSLGLSVGGRLGWRLRAGRDWSVTAALVGAPSATFRVEGLKVPRDGVMPSVGVRVGLGERVDAGLTYSADVWGDKVGHVGSAIVRVRW